MDNKNIGVNMSTTLVIVESQKKGKTIEKLLGDGYKVVACGGHIRDMTKNEGLGFNRKTLEIDYEMSTKNKDFVRNIRKLMDIGKIGHVILAADPDREGEAIAQSLKDEIGLKDSEYERCKFNEITKEAVTKAIKGSSGERELIDNKMVDAQESRRILDRYIGWKGSRAVSDRIFRFAPIGRVQTQALRFIVERELAIKNFTPQEYYALKITSKDKCQETAIDFWTAKLDAVASGVATLVDNGESKSNVWLDGEFASRLKAYLDIKPSAKCIKSFSENRTTNPPPPFTTTTMQQAAINNLGLSGKKVDQIAQELYQEGYITYPRTDSTRLSDEGFLLIKAWGLKSGAKIVESKRNFSASEDAQDAHECIRPANFEQEPSGLSAEHLALYKLILARAVMSQMPAKQYEHREAHFEIKFEDKDFIFKAEGNTTLDAGYTDFFKSNRNVSDNDSDEEEVSTDASLPIFKDGDLIVVHSGELKSSKTKAPSLFTQAKLNKKLDEYGIGRPSTYSTIFEKIVEHNYVILNKNKKKAPEIRATSLGFTVVECTQDVFKIMNPEYTKGMEQKLDDIAAANASKDEITHQFLDDFDADIEQLEKTPSNIEKKNCINDDCNGVLYQFTKHKDDGSEFFYWKCRECKQVHFMNNGSLVTPESIMAPFLNSDGSPKYPCPECGSALKRIERKDGGFFWACSNNQLDRSNKNAKSCEYKVNDYEEKPDIDGLGAIKRKEERRQRALEDGTLSSCPICSGDFYEHKGIGKSGKPHHFAKCENCNFSAFPDDNGIINVVKADKLLQYIDGDKPKVPCESCGAVLHPAYYKKSKEDKNFEQGIVCSGIFRTSPKCSYKRGSMSIEEFEKRMEE